MKIKIHDKNNFVKWFDTETGFYMRTGCRKRV